MARIRTIKPEFWSDEKIGPLAPLDRLVFLGLISQADDAGRLLDSPRMLNGLLFPYTDDDCTESLETLEAIGVIERGETTSGQRVIQVIGWSKHQRIEKPNLRGAMQPIGEGSPTRRRLISKAVRKAIIDRAEERCEVCGVQVKVRKDDRYDSSPNLAEIDHITPVADGGTDEPENLRLLCLRCNREKAGRDLSGRNRRKVPDESTTGRGTDLRSTTNDHLTDDQPSPLSRARAWDERRLREVLPASCHGALRTVLVHSGKGAPTVAGSIAAMCGLDPKAIPVTAGMRTCSTEEMAGVLVRLASSKEPHWHQGYVNRILEGVRRDSSVAPAVGDGTTRPQKIRVL